MKRLNRFSLGLVVLWGWTGSLWGQGLVSSEPVAAVDDIPPAPVTNLRALDVSTEEDECIRLIWTPSIDDAVSFSLFEGAVVPRGDVRGYRIYRKAAGEDEVMLATVGPGVSEYRDETVEKGVEYIYSVRPFDLDNETDLDIVPGSEEDLARIILIPEEMQIVVVDSVRAVITFETDLDIGDAEAVEAFSEDFVSQVSGLLGIEPIRIRVLDIRAGSVVVEFEILDIEGMEEDAPSALEALTQLKAWIEEDGRILSDLGTVVDLASEALPEEETPVVLPLDADGNPILGWFTREGDTVDFDDFFLFADHFGLSRGDEGFDPLFDIVEDGLIDFDDFFRFADDFGKVVVNADQVRAAL